MEHEISYQAIVFYCALQIRPFGAGLRFQQHSMFWKRFREKTVVINISIGKL